MVSKRPDEVTKIHSLSRINKDLGRLFSQNILAKSFVVISDNLFFWRKFNCGRCNFFPFYGQLLSLEKVHFFSEVGISPNQFQRNPRVFG